MVWPSGLQNQEVGSFNPVILKRVSHMVTFRFFILLFHFDIQDTFGRAKTWVKELQRQASPNIVIALAGNKADLANKRMVEFEVRVCVHDVGLVVPVD